MTLFGDANVLLLGHDVVPGVVAVFFDDFVVVVVVKIAACGFLLALGGRFASVGATRLLRRVLSTRCWLKSFCWR